MSREVWKVNKYWRIPDDHDLGRDHLHYEAYTVALKEWLERRDAFLGEHRMGRDEEGYVFEVLFGGAPRPQNYMWYDEVPPEADLDHYILVSPTFGGAAYPKTTQPVSTIERLVNILVANGVSLYGKRTGTKEEWTKICNGEEVWVQIGK